MLDLVYELADLSVACAADLPLDAVDTTDPADLAARLNRRFGIQVAASDVVGLDAGGLLDLVYSRMP